MGEFEVNDWVRVIDRSSFYYNKQGPIVEIQSGYRDLWIKVDLGKDLLCPDFVANDLELMQKGNP